MDRRRSSWIVAGIAPLLLVLATATAARAQLHPGLTVSAGAAPYDLSGTGTGVVVGLGADGELSRHLILEAGLRYFSYTPQFGPVIAGSTVIGPPAEREDVGILFPELSVQLQLPLGTVNPYLGAGAGGAAVVEGSGESKVALHGTAGARIGLAGRWSLRPELRVRSVDPFTGSMGDLTLGVRYGI